LVRARLRPAPVPIRHPTLFNLRKIKKEEKRKEKKPQRKKGDEKNSMARRGLGNVTGWPLGDLQPAY
jgi:hypothetical protein